MKSLASPHNYGEKWTCSRMWSGPNNTVKAFPKSFFIFGSWFALLLQFFAWLLYDFILCHPISKTKTGKGSCQRPVHRNTKQPYLTSTLWDLTLCSRSKRQALTIGPTTKQSRGTCAFVVDYSDPPHLPHQVYYPYSDVLLGCSVHICVVLLLGVPC